MSVKIEWNEAALRDTLQQAFEQKAFSGDLDYDCPDCGRKIRITGHSNRCACGFVLNVELGKVEL